MSSLPPWPIGFRTILVRAVLYVLFIGAITQGAYLEALYLPSVRFSELGFTEFTQTLVLATCCAMLIYIRQVLKVWPTITLLLLAFVAASLVREQDHFLDNYVADNTWKVLVALIILPSLLGGEAAPTFSCGVHSLQQYLCLWFVYGRRADHLYILAPLWAAGVLAVSP